MVKSLHRSLEAKLASINPPDYSDSEDDDQPETISAKRSIATGNIKRKQQKDTKKLVIDGEGDEPSSVIYLGHIPVGFEDRELTVFLNQFGNVSRCRVSRSTKSGRSRGYAFVEFVDPEVATIVAETMSGYLLLEKRLVCHVLPKEKVNYELMFAKPKRVLTKKDKIKKARAEENKVRSADAIKAITTRLIKREDVKRKKLEALGIEYDFPGYAASAVNTDVAILTPMKTTKESKKMKSKKVVHDVTKVEKKRKISHDDDDDELKDDKKTMAEMNSMKSTKDKTPKNDKRKSKIDDENEVSPLKKSKVGVVRTSKVGVVKTTKGGAVRVVRTSSKKA
jgi:nucleolar protein 15